MLTHPSSGFQGPVTRARDWWCTPESDPLPGNALPAFEMDPSVRADLVERIRREIAAGTYDTPEKWELALDRLFDRLNP